MRSLKLNGCSFVRLSLYVFVLAVGCTRQGQDEAVRVQAATTTAQTFCTVAEIAKTGYQRETSWNCELRMPWDQYDEFMRRQLGPEYKLESRTDTEMSYRYVSGGDTYTLSAKKMSDQPLQVHLVFIGRPS